MANKMISEEELRDDFLSAIIRSEEPLQAPEGFMDGVMVRIGLVSEKVKLKPYAPPVWLKWGIPAVFAVCLIGLLISGPAKVPVAKEPVVSLFEKASATISSWFTGIKFDLQIPRLNISETVLWVLAGGMVLTWSFVLLFRFLEKKARQ
ncbi:MAG: hypothetical protein NTV01_14820 [Bacteroidia bacterium]|nr:hypothetical protein [Bacteroidia bacterium]